MGSQDPWIEPSPDSSRELGGASTSGVYGSPYAYRNSPLSDSLDGLKSLRNRNPRNPFLGYLNINHLRNKIVDLRLILREIGLEYISISETKLDASFPNAQFKVDGYHFPPFRKDRNGHGGGLIVFVKNDIIASRFTEYEPQEIECICTQVNNSRKALACFFQYTDLQKQEILITFYLHCINL